jgi:hypothetical protein
MSWGSWWRSLFPRGSNAAPPPRRLDGRSKKLLEHSIKTLPYDEPGWITSKEAKSLFCQWTINTLSARWTKWESKKSQASPPVWATDVYLNSCRSRTGSTSFATSQIAEATGIMPKSRAEIPHAWEADRRYSAFQPSRPDLPQGNVWGLSQDELEQLVTAFQRTKSGQADEARRKRPFHLHLRSARKRSSARMDVISRIAWRAIDTPLNGALTPSEITQQHEGVATG